jgi:hypothetical protein
MVTQVQTACNHPVFFLHSLIALIMMSYRRCLLLPSYIARPWMQKPGLLRRKTRRQPPTHVRTSIPHWHSSSSVNTQFGRGVCCARGFRDFRGFRAVCPAAAAGQGHCVGSRQGGAPGAFGCSGLPVPSITLVLVHQHQHLGGGSGSESAVNGSDSYLLVPFGVGFLFRVDPPIAGCLKYMRFWRSRKTRNPPGLPELVPEKPFE